MHVWGKQSLFNEHLCEAKRSFSTNTMAFLKLNTAKVKFSLCSGYVGLQQI